MPCLIRILTPHGLIAANYSADSLADAVQYEPLDGVYTLANTFHTTQVLKFDAHLDRLEDSAQREGIALQLDRPRLRAALRALIGEAGWGAVRFRVTVSKAQPENLLLSLEPFAPPAPSVYANGVRCITLADSARHNAAAKSTRWMHQREAHTLPEGIYTGILLDADGYLLEGTSSNFYAILNGELRSAGAGVLGGIAQQIVYAVAPPLIPVQKTPVHQRDLPQLSEAFITSSSRGIVPVVEIDGYVIGNGYPGTQTQALWAAYQAWLRENLTEL